MDPPDLAALEAISPTLRLRRMGLRIDGVPFDPSRYPFLVELYDEPWPDLRIRKGTQLGLTIFAIVSVIWRMVTTYPRGVLYAFPTDDEVYDFAQSRFDRLLADNPELYRGVVRGTDRTTLKQIGPGYLYFRGMRSSTVSPVARPTKLLSIPVDLVVFDEYDEMEPVAVRTALERLAGSTFRHTIRLGHPSLPGYGIDESFEQGDQRHWMIRCGACGHSQCLELEFPDCLRRRSDGSVRRVCVRCDGELEVGRGEWVPAHRGREARSYWASQLLSPTVPPAALLAAYEQATATGKGLQEFYNLNLGMAWADIEDCLDTETVLNLCDPNRPPALSHEGPCFAGFDVGAKYLYGAIGCREQETSDRILAWPRLETFDELWDVCQKFHVASLVVDGMSETRTVRQFCDRAPFAWAGFYSVAQRSDYRWTPRERQVHVGRTESLDASHLAFVDQRVRLPRATDFFRSEVLPQLVNLARTVLEDRRTGQQRPSWIVRGRKNDHYRHAWNYALIARERVGLSRETERERRVSWRAPLPPLRRGWMGV